MGDVIAFPVSDGLSNILAGLGDPLRDKMAGASYGFQFTDDWELFNIYRSNWLGRKIVDIPAMDAVRKWRNWQASQAQIQAIEAEENRLNYKAKVLEVKTKARLWGGAALYLGTTDTDLMQPLQPERIGRGGLRYLAALSRREMTVGEIEQDISSPYFGKPKYYQVAGASPTDLLKVHPSRMAVFVGAPHPDVFMGVGMNYGWGDSVIDIVKTAMKQSDATMANIASLIFEANVDVFAIPDLMDTLSKDPGYASRLIERFQLAATMKGINRALILDGDEEFERKTISFVGLPDVMNTFMVAVSGAADIPMTRLYGQAPAGMNSTGESDLNNYYDRVSSIQQIEVTPSLYIADECLIRSALGSRPPEIFYLWAPLKQVSETELATIGASNAAAAATLDTTGLFTREELRKAVTNQMVETGFYPGFDQTIADTGPDWKAEIEAEQPTVSVPQDKPVTTKDATPRTLYVKRDVLNGADIVKWARSQGFTAPLDAGDMHVTITYSKTPVDWLKMGNAWDEEITIPRGGARVIERFNGGAIVLAFANRMLSYRHDEMIEAGATTDYPDYQPHVTISYEDMGDIDGMTAYQGEIRLGPEVFAEVDA